MMYEAMGTGYNTNWVNEHNKQVRQDYLLVGIDDQVFADDLPVVCRTILGWRDANSGHQRGQHRRDARFVRLSM